MDTRDFGSLTSMSQDQTLKPLMHVLPVPVAVVRSDGTVLAANPPAEAMMALGPLVGQKLSDFVSDRQECQRVWDTLTSKGGAVRVEVQLRRGNGEDFWGLASAGPTLWGGKPAHILVFQEFTHQKMREQQLRKAREDAEQAVLSKMRFFAAASHDLRQPMQALALFVTALEKYVRTSQTERIFHSLKASLQAMEGLFESLLDMSRLDAGVLKPDPTVFIIADVLEPLEAEFAPQALQAGLKFRVVLSSLAIHSDKEMVTRILRNFISNALRYTRAGGVLLGCRRRGRFLRCEVWDSGVGIAADQQQEIFGEFFQGRSAIKRTGSGLGLAIVQRLAQLLGHRLDLRSVEGKGSVFAVELPLSDMASGDDSSPDDAAAAGADVRGLVVVVIADDPTVREDIRQLQEQWGGRTITARSPCEAVAALIAEHLTPDLILVDLGPHDGNTGRDAILQLRKTIGCDIPAFIMADAMADDDLVSGFPVLRKPLDANRLRAILASVRAM